MNLLRPNLVSQIAVYFDARVDELDFRAVAGGDSHSSFLVNTNGQKAFVKVNQGSGASVLASEYESLLQLNKLEIAHLYPKPLAFVEEAIDGLRHAALLMSCCKLTTITRDNAACAAQGLIEHHSLQNSFFGWSYPNFIGLTAQTNTQTTSWAEFFMQSRLEPQLNLAAVKGLPDKVHNRIERAKPKITTMLKSRSISPSLLHGDLWLGNLAFEAGKGHIALYDPSPYYGDPEVDIAMTRLFGRLPSEFYTGYRRVFRRPENESQLHAIYNLIHGLNHFSLFGAGYTNMIETLLDAIMCE